jgi:hypothetical protein
MIADLLGERMGCFLFQLPPSFRFTKSRLDLIVSQLDPARLNVVEFRHKSWWNKEVTALSGKPESSFALAAAPVFRTNWSGQLTRFMCGCTVPFGGTGMIIRRNSSASGQH